jgi:DNA-binding transcriptional LysR family regulator
MMVGVGRGKGGKNVHLPSPARPPANVGARPARAEHFKRRHPEVAVHLQVENTRRCCGAVARGEADLALVGGVMPPDLEHLLQVRRRALILAT